MAYVQRKIPFVGTPETNPETKPFFDGCAAGKLMLTPLHVVQEGALVSARACARSASATASGKKPPAKARSTPQRDGTRPSRPIAIAYVTLAEGPSMMTNIVDCDLDTLKIGQDVKVKFVPSEDGPPMPFFTPA